MSLFQFAQSPQYDPGAVQPMRDELTAVGIKELVTAEDVDAALEQAGEGAMMVIVNSVCGCAAGNARPGVMLALQNKVIPDQITTVFAGQDKVATDRARQHMNEYPPSSPCIVLFKGGKVVHILQRHDIEDHTAGQVAESLVEAFNQHCSAEGPSISPEELQKIPIIQMCGSSIPQFEG